MSERRCGTCEHWERRVLALEHGPMKYGPCSAGLNFIASIYAYERHDTNDDWGSKCPLWQPKEAAE